MMAIVAQMLTGNLCFMDVAMAASMDRGEEMETVQEMVMTPAHPMSPLHCDSCVTITRPRHHDSDAGGRLPCNDGHCLSEHASDAATVSQSPLQDSVRAAAIPAFFTYAERLIDKFHTGNNDLVAVDTSSIRTVVLRE